MRCSNHLVATLIQFAAAQSIKFPCKDEVLIYGQLVVQRKLLRHVTDHFFDRLQVSHDVMAADFRCPITWFENTAQHPDHGRFPGAVWTEKTEDRSFPDRE